jgi:predicted permease
VFGRLAPGVSLADARREADRIGQRLSASLPTTHEHVRTVVRRYGVFPLVPVPVSDRLASVLVMSWNLPLLLFLILVCGNVALLMFARAATRESELLVRSALGAGRRHIVAQLFTEALVLAALGAAVGLSVARYGLRWGYHIVQIELLEGPLPFWFHPELSLRTVAYTLLLTLVGAAVAGALPALKATRRLGAQLRQASAGAGGLRVGGIWTVVIVVQIAVTIAFPAVAFAVGSEGRAIRIFDLGIPAQEYLTARIVVPPTESDSAMGGDPAAAFRTRSRATFAELEAKLLTDPRVASVTFAERPPRTYNGWNQIEVDGPTAPPQDERGHRLGRVNVEADFFETLGIAPRAGRGFHPADAEAGSRIVIVNEAFVDYVLGGRNAIGGSFRYVASERNRSPDQEPGPWLEIVGVVQDLGAMSGYSSAVVYHPVPSGSMNPSNVLLHVRDDAGGFASRLRAAAFDVDPTLRIEETVTLDRIVDDTVEFYRFWVYTLMMVSGVGVVLSLGGIYAVMSFAVARRTREIGVRVALGATRPRILLSVFRRPLFQVTLGLLMGALLSAFLLGLADTDTSARDLAWFSAYLALMAAVCMSACVTPTRRALAVEPSEALRAE